MTRLLLPLLLVAAGLAVFFLALVDSGPDTPDPATGMENGTDQPPSAPPGAVVSVTGQPPAKLATLQAGAPLTGRTFDVDGWHEYKLIIPRREGPLTGAQLLDAAAELLDIRVKDQVSLDRIRKVLKPDRPSQFRDFRKLLLLRQTLQIGEFLFFLVKLLFRQQRVRLQGQSHTMLILQ